MPTKKKVTKKTSAKKTKTNTSAKVAKASVPDIKIVGNGDAFQLICKASSENEGWMKSTKAMQIDGAGCVIQVTTQQGDNVAEALTYVPGVKLETLTNGSVRLVKLPHH